MTEEALAKTVHAALEAMGVDAGTLVGPQATFVPAQGVREPIETGLQGAVESLAESMIAELRTDW